EVHRHPSVERHVEYGHQFALKSVVEPGRRAVGALGRKDRGGCRHPLSPCLLKPIWGQLTSATPGRGKSPYRNAVATPIHGSATQIMTKIPFAPSAQPLDAEPQPARMGR